MAAVENTGAAGEGNIDPSTNFTEWLQSKGAKQDLINKMLAMDMDSMYDLCIPINNLSTQLTIHRLIFTTNTEMY